MINILFAADPHRWGEYQIPLTKALTDRGLDCAVHLSLSPEEVDYIVYDPSGSLSDFTPYTRCRAVMSLWAGVEKILENITLSLPLTRMVDQGLTRGMVEWVVGHTLRHHLGIDRHVLGQDGVWRDTAAPLAADRSVTVLGMGALGRACAEALADLGFPVNGWNRSRKQIAGVKMHCGATGLTKALSGAQIVVSLLPLTEQTRNLIDATCIASLPKGAVLINPGRGALVDENALIEALDSGHLGHATLDVFEREPLPPEHPFWAHSKITVTPHIASASRPESASIVIAANVWRSQTGRPLLYLVDRESGY
ncbi:MAG: glyoxylate/hydroxypyruvate reductase A [Porticoccaceae bacterium]|nr:glyoxylate/hydroxypyruvate reductase A [Porticoccaceae bacterium]